MSEVLINIGSNIDKEVNVPAAVARLRAHSPITVRAVSAVLETPAIGADGQPANQPSYHNVAVRASTTLSLQQMRDLLRQLEAELGRMRGPDKFAPRTIDLDLAYYGDSPPTATDSAGERALDADVLRFAHVAIPLAEVAPDWVHPATGTTLAAIAGRFGAAHQPAEAEYEQN